MFTNMYNRQARSFERQTPSLSKHQTEEKHKEGKIPREGQGDPSIILCKVGDA